METCFYSLSKKSSKGEIRVIVIRLFSLLLVHYGISVRLCSKVVVLFIYSVGADRLPFKPEGYNYWTWRGHKIHYVVQGEGFPVVLIHGFGASAYHWRFVIQFYLL